MKKQTFVFSENNQDVFTDVEQPGGDSVSCPQLLEGVRLVFLKKRKKKIKFVTIRNVRVLTVVSVFIYPSKVIVRLVLTAHAVVGHLQTQRRNFLLILVIRR